MFEQEPKRSESGWLPSVRKTIAAALIRLATRIDTPDAQGEVEALKHELENDPVFQVIMKERRDKEQHSFDQATFTRRESGKYPDPYSRAAKSMAEAPNSEVARAQFLKKNARFNNTGGKEK